MSCCTKFSIAFGVLVAGQDLFLETAKVSSLSAQDKLVSAQGNFEAQCASEDDHGWPRFQSVDELLASPWRAYFMAVYGEVPSVYPVCVNDFWVLDTAAYQAANITITGHELVNQSDVQEGDLFSVYGGLQIYHDVYVPLPANTWTEITHIAFPTELQGMWVWRTRGTGIWANSGNTVVFPTPADPTMFHQEAITVLRQGCSVSVSEAWPRYESDIFGSCAREKGYDSIQFEPNAGMTKLGTFGQVGSLEMVLVNSDGLYTCGTADASQTELRSGWMASRQCDCENSAMPFTCGVMPSYPNADPPLCRMQQLLPKVPCNYDCRRTTCKLPMEK